MTAHDILMIKVKERGTVPLFKGSEESDSDQESISDVRGNFVAKPEEAQNESESDKENAPDCSKSPSNAPDCS